MRAIEKTYNIVAFIIFYIIKLVEANISIAYDIVTPKMQTNPGFIWVPLRLENNFGLLLFNNLLSMTPGTLSIDISEDKKSLLVHCLYSGKQNEVLEEIEHIQNRIMKLTN